MKFTIFGVIEVGKWPLEAFWIGAKMIIWLYLSNFLMDFNQICRKGGPYTMEGL